MILQRLVDYYDRLAGDPNDPMTPSGFSREKISFALVIDVNGAGATLVDVRDQQGKKFFPRMMPVPDRGGRSGTGLKPNFLWDNTGYVLGRDSKGKPDRSRQAFESFRAFHEQMAKTIDDEDLAAVVRFLKSWSPDRAEALPLFDEAVDKNIVFRIKGKTRFVHESPGILRGWKTPTDEGETVVVGQSLVSGDRGPIARLHPMISGVKDAQTMGAAIASFNLDAFTSYGLEQTYNAPVSVEDAFKYTTALNRLLENRQRRVQIGDATVVFWADRPTMLEEVFDPILGEYRAAGDDDDDALPEDKQRAQQVRAFLTQLREGHAHGDAFDRDSDVGFYVLGLSPNASRISVRFWVQSTVGEMEQRLAQHMSDAEIAGADASRPLTVRGMVNATARVIKGKPDYDTVSPRLSGDVSRAVLTGLPYPSLLLSATLSRIAADAEINADRAAVIKAYLVRKGTTTMDPYLNKVHPEGAYHCGRLLAVLAFAQETALSSINAGVIRRTLGAVMTTPGLQLGRLQRAAEVGHIPKLDRDLQTFVRDELKFINTALRDDLPRSLDLARQGIFMLGFYQELHYLEFNAAQVTSGKRVRTEQGEWVRSNGEARVAQLLTKLGAKYVFEPRAMLQAGSERWPDFVIFGTRPEQNVFIEYLGMDRADYNARWDQKLEAYRQFGAPESGGPNGTLVVLDGRKQRLDDITIITLLRPSLGLTESSVALDNKGGAQ